VPVREVAQSGDLPAMDIRINKASAVPLHEQIAAQLLFLIGTGRLKPGARLPSVRALARRLGIHRNTISRAYQDVTLERLAQKRAGRRLAVRAVDAGTPAESGSLDQLVRTALIHAKRRGYSLRQFYDRVRDEVFAAPPDRLLVLSEEPGMRMLLRSELSQRFTCPADSCSPGELVKDPARSLGALVVSPQGHIQRIPARTPALRVVPITYSAPDEHLAYIRGLVTPSLIVVASVSPYFLKMARGVLAAAAGGRHSVRACLMTGNKRGSFGAADVLLCDSLTYPIVRARYDPGRVFIYRLITDACLDEIQGDLGSRFPGK
jgi:DNA-binding transcriptional regulator YhcF (GntR family)